MAAIPGFDKVHGHSGWWRARPTKAQKITQQLNNDNTVLAQKLAAYEAKVAEHADTIASLAAGLEALQAAKGMASTKKG